MRAFEPARRIRRKPPVLTRQNRAICPVRTHPMGERAKLLKSQKNHRDMGIKKRSTEVSRVMQSLLDQLERSIVDGLLTSAEKSALAADLQKRPWRIDQLRQLRNHAFELVLQRARNPSAAPSMPALVKWLSDVVKMLDQVNQGAPVDTEVWFSPGSECRSALVGHFAACRKRVDICVFTIADDAITTAIRAAHQRGVVVRIISDNDKRLDSGSDIAELINAGIDLRLDDSDAHMHHKFVIFDQRWLLNGSFNWTRSASQFNDENLVATNDPQQLQQFSTQFEALWQRFA